MSSIMLATAADIGKYFMHHELLEPSRMSDYDYDPENESRRFYSILMHRLSIYDKVTHAELIKIDCASDTMNNMIAVLNDFKKKQKDSSNTYECGYFIPIRDDDYGVYLSGGNYNPLHILYSVPTPDTITFAVMNRISDGFTRGFCMDISIDEVDAFIDLLNLESKYVKEETKMEE